MVNVLDYYILVTEFELQSHNNLLFQTKTLVKDINPALCLKITQLLFNKEGFGIK